jgi:hypothetical protein
MNSPQARRIGLVSFALLIAAATGSASATPIDFGEAELARAFQERGSQGTLLSINSRIGGS